MKAKVIQTEYSLSIPAEIFVVDEDRRDSFEESMLREGFSEVEHYKNEYRTYKNWFVFKDDESQFSYHRSWLEFEE